MNNSRALITIIAVALFFAALVFKLFDIQILKNEELKYLAERQQTALEKITAERGLIYDRNNILLAYNRNDISFYLDLRMVSQKNKKEIAQKFSAVFGKPVQQYMKLMQVSGRTICLEKKAPGEKALLLKNYTIAGLFYKEDPTRVYHYDNLASHLLGFVGNEYTGVTGVERSFEEYLKGEEGSRLVERNAMGQMITVEENETKSPVPGENIYLTINKSYQAILEEEIKKGVTEYGGTSATGIIMDPNTGEILALANAEDYNPNEYWKYTDTLRRNKALTDTYEPGSTFKSITLAALYDQKLCRDNEVIYAENGRYKYKNVNITDSHNSGNLTVAGVFEQSSNIGVAKLSQRIDDEIYYKYLRGFGFGNYTSIGLPGEASGFLKKPTSWTPITKAFISFGYEISVTPVQMITAYSAIINGGTLYQPQILKRRMNQRGMVTFEDAPKQVRTVISPGTSAKMRQLMRQVVVNGTGKSANSTIVTVGGKTGTSQQLVNGSYSKQHYNSSFIGFFPVENPKVVCLVLVNAPQKGRYGGLVAAPIFKNIAEKIVINNPADFKNGGVKSSSEAGQDMHVMQASLKENNETYKPVIMNNNGLMPDLTGTQVRDAITALTKAGIKYRVTGGGKVISQSISPGKKLQKGMFCILQCEAAKVNGTVIY